MLEELLPLLAELSDPGAREQASRRLASRLNCSELVVFVKDFELDIMLPAPGFPQTLPEAPKWQAFLRSSGTAGEARGSLIAPSTGEDMCAIGINWSDGALVLLGGRPDQEALDAARAALPLLISALRGEQALQTALVYKEQAQKAEVRAATLTSSLDMARRDVDLVDRVARTLSGELDLDKLVQSLTDVSTLMVGAQFGAFLYNQVNEHGESYTLYTLSGAPREAFSHLPMPRNTALFNPTFRGEGTVRLDDVTLDRRYGTNAPFYGLPEGHPPVRSYLAVPVKSARSEVLGGLFFGHAETSKFSARHERLIESVARWAAIAIENAHLFLEAQHAALVKDQFLGLISHELRTPLAVIFGNAVMIQRYGAKLSADERDQALRDIVSESGRLQAIIENLLTLTRLGSQVLETEVLHLEELVQESIEEFRRRNKNREVLLNIQNGVPAARGQPTLFRLVLENVLSNASKYSQPDTTIEVDVGESETRWPLVTVRDSGVGMDETDTEKMFQPFFRSSRTESKVGGMGLGLTVCKRAIEAQGGTLEVESTLDVGTEVRVTLPPA